MDQSAAFKTLMDHYLAGTITREEQDTLQLLLRDESLRNILELYLQESFYHHTTVEGDPDWKNHFQNNVFNAIAAQQEPVQMTPPLHRVGIKKWWAAACVLLILATAGWLLFQGPDKQDQATGISQTTDIPPGMSGAILTLADGRRIILDSLGNGLVAQEGQTAVMLQQGELTYKSQDNKTASVTYNTMSTPKGRQFTLQLPDGTKLWLNAASSVRYPVAFNGNERRVEISGEAYFEVTKNPQKPFIVEIANGPAIRVLGTRFNVNAYNNEPAINTTLLEGSVKISKGETSVLLSPSQQARFQQPVGGSAPGFGITNLNDSAMSQVMAWRNGVFNFNNIGLKEVMRQLERWYDIEVRYEGKVPISIFHGEMGRDLSLREVLNFLSRLQIKHRLEGRTLTITNN